MNKTELIDKIAAGAEISKVQAKKALEAAMAAVQEALVAGDKVALIGFGTPRAPLPAHPLLIAASTADSTGDVTS